MTLEQQLQRLADLGLVLNDGIVVDDLLYSFGRDAFEKRPFNLVLFVLGTEVERAPWGRPFCSRVWDFDTECIATTGGYVRIVNRLCQVAGEPDRLSSVSDFVDIRSGKAWLTYRIDGAERNRPVVVNDDWADSSTIAHVMDDIQRDGRRFYFKDNGQAMVLFYLDPGSAAELNEVSNNALKPVLPQ
jgi:hypothetical protein